MILKVFLITIVLLAISLLGIGLKILFNKPSKQTADGCVKNDFTHQKFGCGCGGGFCE